jgi:starch synthase
MSDQKGIDLIADVVPELHRLGAKLVVLGSGEPALESRMAWLGEVFRDQMVVRIGFDLALSRRIYAGSDLFAMPSRFEPCGLGQMIALRYGTPPVVRRTGGLADSVLDVDEHPGRGTGFVFDEATPGALAAAVGRAVRLRARDGAAWGALQDRALACDFGWGTSSAPRYLDAYRRAVALRRR